MASIRSNAGLLATSLIYFASLGNALPALGDFKYQGCYTDSQDARSLTGKVSLDAKMTLQKCASICNGYPWFGVEEGAQCYCGSSLADTAEKRPNTECKIRCGGSRCQLCGDVDRINVYWTGRDAIESSTTESSSVSPTPTSESIPASETTTIEGPSTSEATSESTTSSESTTTETTTTSETTTSESTTTTEPTTPDESSITPSSTSLPETTTTLPETTTTLPETTTTEPPTPTIPSTTTSACELTTTLLPTPATCWASMPKACASLSRTRVQPAEATSCRSAFLAGAAVPPQIASCFTDIGKPTFQGTVMYDCVQGAGVFCASKTVCKEDVGSGGGGGGGGPAVNVLGEVEGGFENGVLWPADNSQMGGDDVIKVEISGEVVRSGQYSIKAAYSNGSGGSRNFIKQVVLEPGAEYEASWWWWSSNAESSTVSRIQFIGGEARFVKDSTTFGGPVGQWVRVEQRFVAAASFGTVRFSMFGNRGNAANTFYVDDLRIARVD